MDLARALQRVVARETLERAEARDVFARCLCEGVDPAQLGALLGALAARGEAAAEIAGAADALRDAMVPFVHDHPDAIDTAGTGGDGLSSFNLSTAAAIVAAAAGARVIKHGNRSQSSRCGSADLLECAGIPLDLSPGDSRRVLDEVGITFLFAPAYHPALRHAAPVRRALGVRTVFNFLGPLANPGRVRRQLIGVPEERRVGEIARVLTDLGHERGYVVFGSGGADELSLAGNNRVEPVGDAPRDAFDAGALGLIEAPCEALAGGDARTNLAILMRVLGGERGAPHDAVVLNASAALVVAGRAASAREGVELSQATIASGRALATIERWVEVARRKESAA
jgi:anthranilate phosphoribosyltransferase